MRLSHFWEVLSVNLDHSALKNGAPGKFGVFGLIGFSLFFCLAGQFANRSMFSTAFFFNCRGKRGYQMTIIGFWLSPLLRKCGCFWTVVAAPCWRRCDTWGQRPSVHHVSQQTYRSRFCCQWTNRPFLQFSPHSAGERQASHKKIKDCEMTESRFLAFARLLSIEPFSETAAIIPWAEKSRQVLQNQDGEKKKTAKQKNAEAKLQFNWMGYKSPF